MGGIGDAIKYLYSQFLLRDVLSFIAPGAMVVFSAVLLFLPSQCLSQQLERLFSYSLSFHWLLYIPIFSLFYIVGFAIQCFGRILGCIRIHALDKSCWKQRMKVFCCDWANHTSYGWERAQEEVVNFLNATVEADWARQHHERLVVLKQMCANGALAIGISGMLVLINGLVHKWYLQMGNWWFAISFVVFIVILPVILCWGYRTAELGLLTIGTHIISLKEQGKLKRDKQV